MSVGARWVRLWASIPGYDLATADGRDVRVRMLRIADERVDGERDVAGAATSGWTIACGPATLRAPGGHRFAATGRQKL
jgi:hypothetical protein